MSEGTFKIKQSGKKHADMASSSAPTVSTAQRVRELTMERSLGSTERWRRVGSQNCLSSFPKTPFSSSPWRFLRLIYTNNSEGCPQCVK